MYTIKPKTEIAMRLILLVVFVVYSLVPSRAALSLPVSAGELTSPSGKTTPNSKEYPPVYYEPPQFPSALQTEAEGDEPPSPVPPKDDIEFFAAAEAAGTDKNLLKISATIRNSSGTDLVNLSFRDSLETGFDYSANSASPVTYNPQKREVVLSIGRLASGGEFTFEYFIRMSASKRGQIRGKIWVHEITLTDGANINLTAPVSIGADVAAASSSSSSVAAVKPGKWNRLGNVNVFMDPETIGQDGVIVYNPVKAGGKGPEIQFWLDVFRSSVIAKNASGYPNEQAVSLQKAFTGNFGKPAFLEIQVGDYFDLNNIPAGQEPYVATYDEGLDVWIKVPILETDYTSNTLTVEAAHFSTWGAGLGSSLPQNGANVLLFDQPYTSLFTGASRYSIPIWTPPGRAGMTPDVSLSYSSATVDGVLGDVQAPWTGVGWNIDGIEIVRKITTNNNGYGYINDFALTLNGALYQLEVDSQNPSRYYTDRDAFLYIERHNYAFGNQKLNGADPINTTGEWWEVVTTDGTRYRLGWNPDAEQLALMYGYKCMTGGLNCMTPDGAYATLGYAGIAENLVALRWRVDRITDTHGNYISYTYAESQPSGSTTIAPFDRESYLEAISYTGYKGSAPDLAPAYHIHFVYGDRSSVGDVPVTFNLWDNVDTKLLDKIEVCYLECSGAGIVRTYDLGYSLAPVPNANGTLTLTSVSITGRNGSTITQAPTIRFTYENKDNRAASSSDEFPYPRLKTIDNGAGGLLTYTYENDGRGTNSWYNYRVKQVEVESGMGTAALQSYTYAAPVYTGIGTDTTLGELIGYTTVTENQLDYNNGNSVILATKHTFGTKGLDIGRETKTEWLDGTTVLRKATNVYVTDNSQAPYFGWNFRYLYSTLHYELSGGSLILTSKTVYNRDPGTGNLLSQIEYLGNSVYRKTYYEYVINPNAYITDKASRLLLVDASNRIVSDTRYHYDGGVNLSPTTGDLTLVQRLTGSGNQTVDTATDYDEYGNAIAVHAFYNYGTATATVMPSGPAQTTTTVYDASLKTYPVQTTNALGQSSTTEYVYALGLPASATDPNGWTTTTTYDGLGRTLSVQAPGLTQPGVYYLYPQADANGRIHAPYAVEMQILDTAYNVYRSVWGIYDGLGRMIQTQVFDADAGKTLVSDSYFNAQGLVYRQSLPYYWNTNNAGYHLAPSGAQFTETTFDKLGRVLSVTQPGGIVSTTAYDGLTTTSTDPNGNQVSRTADGLGRMILVKEYDGSTVYAATSYSYDEGDRLISVRDARGNVTSIEYDWLGRKTGMNDPDMGEWSYVYDALGNLASQTDARGVILNFEYDALNRLTRKSGDGVNATYAYGDTPGEIGMRTGMSDQSGSASWSYSNFGRTVTEERAIGGNAQSMTTITDWLGRPLSVTYPDGEVLTYSYDSLGRPVGMDSSQSASLVDLAYNALGQITSQTLGNGVVITNAYNSANRLQTRTATKGQTQLLSFSYAYDANGNITKIVDDTLSETHFYGYDFLNRLTSAIAGEGALANPPAAPQVYGQEFEYDQVGNILQVNDYVIPTQGAYREPAPFVDAPAVYRPAGFALQQGATDTPTETPTVTLTPTITPVPTNTQPPP